MGSTLRLAICLLLTGCALVRPSMPDVEDVTVAQAASGAASASRRTPAGVLQAASTLCVKRINELERWGQNWNATVLTVGSVGMIAGAIIVPALAAANAAKSAIAAWGGVSGVSSGVLTLAQGQKLSESQAAADLLRGQLIDGYTEYALAGNEADKMKTAVKLYGRCLFAPATVTAYQPVDYNLMIKAASAAAAAADAAASAASSAAAAASAVQDAASAVQAAASR